MELLNNLKSADTESWEKVNTYFTNSSAGLFGRPRTYVGLHTASPHYGYFSKELLNQLIVRGARSGVRITDVFASKLSIESFEAWSDPCCDGVTKGKIFTEMPSAEIWSVTFHTLPSTEDQNKVYAFDFNKETDAECLHSIVIGKIK